MTNKVHEVGGILAVVDREGAVEADRRRELAQQAGTNGMEGA